jgi:hypothetical protein
MQGQRQKAPGLADASRIGNVEMSKRSPRAAVADTPPNEVRTEKGGAILLERGSAVKRIARRTGSLHCALGVPLGALTEPRTSNADPPCVPKQAL